MRSLVPSFTRYFVSVGALLFLFSQPGVAEHLRVENVRYVSSRDTGNELRVLFDVSWQHAWHNDRNHDATWIFVKQVAGGAYRHTQLAAGGHTVVALPGVDAPPARIDVSEDRAGFFVYPAEPYRGDVQWRLSMALDAEDFEGHPGDVQVAVFGIEMVYVPEGPFVLGDPGEEAVGFGAFYRSGGDGAPGGLFPIDGEAALSVGAAEGQLYYQTGEYQGDGDGPVPAAFPKGYRAFYLMKYELTQGQYVAFLNTLPDEATFERFSFGGRSYFESRGTIRLEKGRYVAGRPDRPLNFSTWDDELAFADWAALRPMTELEFTKASRGPETPEPNAYPGGTAVRDRLARIVGTDDDLVMISGWDEGRLTDETRPVFGASYYWLMDLAGSVWERVITIGTPDGRAFTGSHGDGRLGDRGRATNADWPHTFLGREGHGYRGGGFYDQGRAEHEFNPYSPVAYRRFGAWSGAYPHRAYGFRCARTAAQ